MFEQAPDGVLFFDLDGVVIDCNPKCLFFADFSKKDFVGKSFVELAKLLDGDFDFSNVYSDLSAGKTIEPFELTFRDSDNKQHFGEVRISLLTNALDKLTGFMVVIRDITKRKTAELALQDSEKRFRELSELLPDVVFETDSNGLLTFVNQGVYDQFGFSEAEFKEGLFEDASWPVMQRQAAEVGRSIAELETEVILDLYDNISASDLAGGSAYNGSGTLDWAGFVGFWNRLKKENLTAKVIAINPDQLADLWQEDEFIHSFYFGDKVDVARGVLGQSYLGMKIVVSTKVTSGTVYAIDTDVAAAMLLRRDIMTEPFENPKKDRYGIVGSERVGLGVLRSKAVARGTGW